MKIQYGTFQFHSGCIDEYNFDVFIICNVIFWSTYILRTDYGNEAN